MTEALRGYADSDFSPPIPRPRPQPSAKDAFFYGLMFAALAVTAFETVFLLNSLIDIWLAEPGSSGRSYRIDNIRWAIATIIVFGPVFFWLNRRSNRSADSDPAKKRSPILKWLSYVTLFVSALTLAGDLVYVIYRFLDGDITLRFLAKAAVVAVVAGLVFGYFRQKLRDNDDEAD